MRARISIFLLLVVLGAVVGFSIFRQDNRGTAIPVSPGGGASSASQTLVNGYVDDEMLGFAQDPEVAKILREKYALGLHAEKRGSMEMVSGDAMGQDFLWPSNVDALRLVKQKHPSASVEPIFKSPIVIYSWDMVTDVLIKLGIVQQWGDSYYIMDTRKLLGLMDKEVTWDKLGMEFLQNKLFVHCTDPGKTSTGQLFAVLLADTLTGNRVNDAQKLHAALPTVKRFFSKQKLAPASSRELFEAFLTNGMGDKQLAVGVEAQLIEYSVANPQVLASRHNTVRVLYPRPTAWSTHPVIALNSNARRLAAALKDPQLQELAWRKHGLRSAAGLLNDPQAAAVSGIPATIDDVVQLPTPAVMQAIENEIEGK